ncbi:MAG: ATP-binding protein [Rhizobiaceae bacterium]
MQAWGIVFAAIAYLLFLFVVASYGDRRRAGLRLRDNRSRSAIYALSLAVYCTSWTFFGSVGLATTSGLDFLAIYLGPVLMITVGYPLFSHIIAVTKSERITSIADFIASRYGKSTAVGAVATVIAVLGTVPYIALQLKAISSSVDTMVGQYQPLITGSTGAPVGTSFFVSLLLALFAILFGTRHADATEHQDGLMLAVATESIIKLIAFLIVGLFVTFYMFDGVGDLITQAEQSTYVSTTFTGSINPSKFLIFTLLSFFAFVLLPRQFHAGVVENHSQDEVKTARWLFPLYLVLINLFVIPVAIGGMLTFGSSVDADNYVLALPLGDGAWPVSFLVFVGGLSAATAMVIVACVALAIMISNNLVLPLVLRRQRIVHLGRIKDMANTLLNIRRTAIFLILSLAYGYFKIAGDSAALASIGLLSFAAVAQFAPAFFLGMFWRRPTALSALCGMSVGFGMWTYTLFLPTVLDSTSSLMQSGPFGIDWLHPQALFGVDMATLNHGVMFSLLANTVAYSIAAFIREPKPIERMQAGAFWILGRRANTILIHEGRSITVAELKHVVANYLGQERCERAFVAFYEERDEIYENRELADGDLILHSEQLLASAIGAASSRLVMSLLLQKHDPVGETTIQLLDDASEAIQYNHDLLQTALDQVEQGISVFDKDFRLSSWNRQFRVLLDIPIKLGQVGTPLTALTETISSKVASSIDAGEQLTKKLLEIDRPFQITLEPSGRIIEVLTKSVPDGGLVISWNDTTEKSIAARALQVANETLEGRVKERTEELTRLNKDLARAREAAEAANIGKTKFLAAVGHDILQPLNAARLYTSSLVEQLAKSPTQKIANNIDDSLESVEDILGAVLAISRLDSGVLVPNVTVFPIERLFKKLEVEFSPIAEAKGLQLKVLPNGFHVRSDYSLLRRLLQNLVSNAIKYTEKGAVTLDARVKRNAIVFEVHDTGSGIDNSEREAIFQEFLRLEAGKKAAPGLGLGLSIVKRLAATLNHTIDFKSIVGSGSTFSVIAPLAIAKEVDEKKPRARRSPKLDLSTITVLCIDNERRILEGMRTLLGGWGCEVHVFEEATDLLQALPTINADVIVADYHLNKETGLEVIEDVRAQLGADFPAVLITADRSAAVRSTANAAEVVLMNKPLKPAALRALFSGILKTANANTKKDPSLAAE